MLTQVIFALLGARKVKGRDCPASHDALPSYGGWHCFEGQKCRFDPVYCDGEFFGHATIATCHRDGHAYRWSIMQAFIRCPNLVTPQLGHRTAERLSRHSEPSFTIGNEDQRSSERRQTDESTSQNERLETDDWLTKFGSQKEWGLSDSYQSEFGSNSDFFSHGPEGIRFDLQEEFGTEKGHNEENLSQSEWLNSDPFFFNFGTQKEGSSLNTAESENGSKSQFLDLNDEGTSFGSLREWGNTASRDKSSATENTWGTGLYDGGVVSGGSASEFSNDKFAGVANHSASEFFNQDYWNTRFGTEDKSSTNQAASSHYGNEELDFGPDGVNYSKTSDSKSSTASENKWSSSHTTIQHGRRLAAEESDVDADHLLAPVNF